MHKDPYPARTALVAVLLGALLPTAGWPGPGDGLPGTAHDFANQGSPPTGLCTFCHTPHRSLTQALIWNHVLSTKTFTWDRTETGLGTPYAPFQGDTYTGATAKCLGCHDGSVAIGDLVWWNAGRALVNSDRISPRAQMATADGKIATGHPVAMPFPFNGLASAYNGVQTGPRLVADEWVLDPTALGISLYNDDGNGQIHSGPVAAKTGIECSSCHDPHNGRTVEADPFLRGTPGGICDKCHAK